MVHGTWYMVQNIKFNDICLASGYQGYIISHTMYKATVLILDIVLEIIDKHVNSKVMILLAKYKRVDNRCQTF